MYILLYNVMYWVFPLSNFGRTGLNYPIKYESKSNIKFGIVTMDENYYTPYEGARVIGPDGSAFMVWDYAATV